MQAGPGPSLGCPMGVLLNFRYWKQYSDKSPDAASL
jgi:hypothetical protein